MNLQDRIQYQLKKKRNCEELLNIRLLVAGQRLNKNGNKNLKV